MFVITGATGNIGSKLTAILLSEGRKVRVVGRRAERLRPFVDKGAEAAVGNMEDAAFLTRTFAGATAVFAMIPPDYTSDDFRGHYNRIGASIAEAIKSSGVKYIVNLSSQGADLTEKTGPIVGLHDQEERLNKIEGVNILHLRPTYFMENLLAYVDMIRTMDVIGSPIRGDLRFAMIATKDIAKAVAGHLMKQDFSGKSVRDLLGQRDVSMKEATAIIGRAINKPDLRYVEFSYEDTEKGLISAGVSADVTRLFIEMYRALNAGLICVNVARNKSNTTETSLEEFTGFFAQVYLSKSSVNRSGDRSLVFRHTDLA